jgi:hypothetical protein
MFSRAMQTLSNKENIFSTKRTHLQMHTSLKRKLPFDSVSEEECSSQYVTQDVVRNERRNGVDRIRKKPTGLCTTSSNLRFRSANDKRSGQSLIDLDQRNWNHSKDQKHRGHIYRSSR